LTSRAPRTTLAVDGEGKRMADQPKGPKGQSRATHDVPARRDDRLAAALKANLARRKAQARQRARPPEKPETPRN
jgi:hypothetical protein